MIEGELVGQAGERPGNAPAMRVGLISDTYGPPSSESLAYLRGSNLIVHCGGIGGQATLDALRSIAPTIAVRGRGDSGPWARSLLQVEMIRFGSELLCAIHDVSDLHLDPVGMGARVLLAGHSTKAGIEMRAGCLQVTMGAWRDGSNDAGERLGELLVDGANVAASIVGFPDAKASPGGRPHGQLWLACLPRPAPFAS